MYRIGECMRNKEIYTTDERRTKNPLAAMGIALTVSIVMTILLLLLVTVLVYNTNISGTVSGILLVAIYVLAPFSGAFVLGKIVKRKRFLWGLLLAGVYFVVSRLSAPSESMPVVRDYIEVLLAVLPGGILGGMFS